MQMALVVTPWTAWLSRPCSSRWEGSVCGCQGHSAAHVRGCNGSLRATTAQYHNQPIPVILSLSCRLSSNLHAITCVLVGKAGSLVLSQMQEHMVAAHCRCGKH